MKGILQTLLGVVIALIFLAFSHDEPKPIEVTVKQEKYDYSEWEQFPRVEYVQEDPKRVQARAILRAQFHLMRQQQEQREFEQEQAWKQRIHEKEVLYNDLLMQKQFADESFDRRMQIELISRMRPDVHLHDPFNPYGHQCHSLCHH